MGWRQAFWDNIDQLFWSPKYLGLQSISQRHWTKADGHVQIPGELVNTRGPLYTRHQTAAETMQMLGRSEELLNSFFDLTFSMAADAVVHQLLFQPLGFATGEPITWLGRDIATRYGWGMKNVTQQDGLFLTDTVQLGVELKLASSSSPDQVLKYIALMVLEGKHSFRRDRLGLLFITPPVDEQRFWIKCGLSDVHIDALFLPRALAACSNGSVRSIIVENSDLVRDIIGRLQLARITWTELLQGIETIMAQLDQARSGDQTLYRLLDGFSEQLRAHGDTGIVISPDGELG